MENEKEPEPHSTDFTKKLRIFISSPGDVELERKNAKQVIEQLQKWYGVADGKTYASGTEREFEIMLQAHAKTGGEKPDILFYRRNDDDSFNQYLTTLSTDSIKTCLTQKESAEAFFQTHFKNEDGTNQRAYHDYQQPVEFASRLKVHLRGLIDEQFSQGTLQARASWTDRPPYRGLEAFHLKHQKLFRTVAPTLKFHWGHEIRIMTPREFHAGCQCIR